MAYITIQDIRDAGVPEADYDDDAVTAAITTWQPFIDRACRQWFESREMTLLIDGNDSDTLHFGVPIIDIEYVKLNNSTDELDTDKYKIYNRADDFIDRMNPRIQLVNTSTFDRDIFASYWSKRVFVRGTKNQEIKGTFGYLESDGSTPQLIQRALTLLVIEKLTQPLYLSSATPTLPAGSVPASVGSLLEEKTDDHKRRYADVYGETKPRAAGLKGITNNPEILGILKLYKAPIGCATQAAWTTD